MASGGGGMNEVEKPIVPMQESEHEKPIVPMPIKVKPYEHQVRGFNFVVGLFDIGRKGVAILADMGTGKTVTTIAVAGAMNAAGKANKVLVVCPKSIVGVWEEEFHKFADFGYRLTVLEGDTSKKTEQLRKLNGNGLQVAVVNYESCWRLEPEIGKWKPDMIVCDESSKIKNPQAKQAKALHRLGAVSKCNVILTGTPLLNGPLDFFSQYKFLDPTVLGGSFYGFRARYAILGGYGNHAVVGYRHLDELTEKAHSIAFRVRLDEAVDLPPYIDETRYIALEPKAKAVYDDIDRESYAETENGGEITVRNVLTRLLRLSQVTGGFIRPDEGEVISVSTAKLEALEDILETSLDEGRKVVVFARFIPEIDAITRLLRSKKISYSVIHGGITDRAEQVARFQSDPDCKVFVGQLQTTGMGLTLTAASVVVFYSLDFSSANHEQSRARVHRIGQTRKQLYFYLVCKGTVDEKVLEALKRKKDISTLLVDEYKKLRNAGSVAENEPQPDDSS
jgi:SNF2 family DNA or RNA helicase